MSVKTYKDSIDWNYEILKEIAEESMKNAGIEEKEFAIKQGQLHEGMPFIYNVTDGSWTKRSYGTNYSSPSGLGVIIGCHTGKVLHVGIKNNYC